MNQLIRIEWIFLLVGLIIMLFTLDPVVTGDGAVRYEVVQALLNGEKIPPIKFSLVLPILSMPIAYMTSYLGLGAIKYVAYFNLLIFVALGSVLGLLLSRIYTAKKAVRFLLLILAASMLPHHLQHYYGEVLSALFIVTGVFFLINGKKLAVVVLVSLGIANTPILMVPIVAAVLSMLITKSLDRKYLSTVVASILMALLIIIVEVYLKFGLSTNPYFSSGEKGFQTILPYSGMPGFSYPLFFGVLSIIFSFGKGLLFFIPGLGLLLSSSILQKLRLNTSLSLALFVFCLSLILVYSKWWAWYGGNFWGPRFFLILTFPASLALAEYVDESIKFTPAKSIVFSLTLILSVWVAINGYVFGQKNMGMCWSNNYQLEFLCWYSPEFSALWRPFVSEHVKFKGDNVVFGIWQLVILSYFLSKIIRRDFKASTIK